MNLLVQGRMDGEAIQESALAINVIVERARAHRVLFPFLQESVEEQLEYSQLQPVHALVLDQFGRTQRGQLRLHFGRVQQSPRLRRSPHVGDLFQIQINRVAIKNRIGQIRAGIERLPVRNVVQRVQRDEARAGAGSYPINERLQVAGIAASPISLGTHAVQTHSQTGRTPRFQPSWLVGAAGANDETRVDRRFAVALELTTRDNQAEVRREDAALCERIVAHRKRPPRKRGPRAIRSVCAASCHLPTEFESPPKRQPARREVRPKFRRHADRQGDAPGAGVGVSQLCRSRFSIPPASAACEPASTPSDRNILTRAGAEAWCSRRQISQYGVSMPQARAACSSWTASGGSLLRDSGSNCAM